MSGFASQTGAMQRMNRTLATWAAVSLVGALGLVGGAAMISRDPASLRDDPVPVIREPLRLEPCDLGDGRVGHVYDGLCLLNPPFASGPLDS